MRLLHIDSSITGAASASRQVTAQIVNQYKAQVPGLAVVHRDLDAAPLPHLDSRMLAAMAPGAAPDAQTRDDLERSAGLLDEFLKADIVVVGAPMYNFAIPSQLKAWIDRIAVAGKTFRYTAEGPQGLAGGKTVIVASARGGVYAGDAPAAAMDFQETYLKAVFGFLGVTDVRIVRAEGLAIGPQQREAAIAGALAAASATPGRAVTAAAA
jgi:FMN-dependent NADH-azoreductase